MLLLTPTFYPVPTSSSQMCLKDCQLLHLPIINPYKVPDCSCECIECCGQSTIHPHCFTPSPGY